MLHLGTFWQAARLSSKPSGKPCVRGVEREAWREGARRASKHRWSKQASATSLYAASKYLRRLRVFESRACGPAPAFIHTFNAPLLLTSPCVCVCVCVCVDACFMCVCVCVCTDAFGACVWCLRACMRVCARAAAQRSKGALKNAHKGADGQQNWSAGHDGGGKQELGTGTARLVLVLRVSLCVACACRTSHTYSRLSAWLG